MNKRKIISVIVIAIALISFLYTWNSSANEPHPPNLSITSYSYSTKIAEMDNGSTTTLFYHTFSIGNSNATYGFSFNSRNLFFYVVQTWGGQIGEQISMTKVNQSMGFPYFGTFILQVDTGKTTISFNNRSYESAIKTPPCFTCWPPISNGSVAKFGWEFASPVNVTLNSGVNGNTLHPPINNLSHIRSYNLTYSIEVTPIVEFGPYYITGKTQWISHTFEYPFPTSS